jgi:hypothetical protein
LPLRHLDVDVGRDEIRQTPGLIQVRDGNRHFVRQHGRDLDDALEQRLKVLDQALHFEVGGRLVGRRQYERVRAQIRLGLRGWTAERDARGAVQQDLQTVIWQLE